MRQQFLSAFIILLSVIMPEYSQAQRTYASQSVLANGTWYKLALTETGVYKVDRDLLQSLGVNISSIDPRKIQIFGNSGAMLPQQNSDPRYDDLKENAIMVVGEEDGSFDGDDYVAFYGEGPHIWRYDNDEYHHQYHLYSDTSYYFLHIGDDNGLRIEDLESQGNGTYSPQHSQGLLLHHQDLENPVKSGRYWLGEKFSGNQEQTFEFDAPDVFSDGSTKVNFRLIARNNRVSTFRGYVDQASLGQTSVNATNIDNNESLYYQSKSGRWTFDNNLWNGSELPLRIEYNRGGETRAAAWVDWLEINYDQAWDIQNRDQVAFAVEDGAEPGATARLSIAGGDNNYQLWDVSNPLTPRRLLYDLSGDRMAFNLIVTNPKRLLAWKGNLKSPASARSINNQNLHGLDPVDYLVITHPLFRDEAERLAEFHATFYGQSIHVTTPDQIFNEFSSGMQDITAIRDFIKMMYDRSEGTQPEAVLLFGDGTYDYKGKLTDGSGNSATTNFIPTYQSRNSWDPIRSYVSDDYFGFMDEDEGFWGEGSGIDNDFQREVNLIDVPVGRLPVETVEEAREMVDKVVGYVSKNNVAGPWRNRVVLVGDYKEGEGATHIRQADSYSDIIERESPCTNLEKIFIDNFNVVPTPTNPLFPDAREALLNEFDRGSLIVNYTGHGGEFAWSNSRIFVNGDIASFNNDFRLPAVVTATCEFGRFDDPGLPKSGGELMLLEPTGGSIVMFTTVRLVFSFPNATLNANFYREAFKFDNEKGRMPSVGEIMMRTKNRTFVINSTTNINSRNFTLLGDPGLILNYPKLEAEITSINNLEPSTSAPDTLQSLSTVEINGRITDANGNPMPEFSGVLNATVFDKPSTFTTQLSDYTFSWQKNQIFNGAVSIENGEFSFKFVVPIDISYDPGFGKISLYFSNPDTDGSGCYSNLYIGGTAKDVQPDQTGPEMQLYINDESWVDGSITSPDPLLLVQLQDPSGINSTGVGIGHEIIGILDGDEANPIILNSFYQAQQDSYTSGEVRYQFRDLEAGPHKLLVRVWDGANNPSEGLLSFVVTNDGSVVLDRVKTVPNPAGIGETIEFWLSHNQTGNALSAEVEIYSVSGHRVAYLEQDLNGGSSANRISWNGTNDEGLQVSPGIYIYQLLMRNKETGQDSRTQGKILIHTR